MGDILSVIIINCRIFSGLEFITSVVSITPHSACEIGIKPSKVTIIKGIFAKAKVTEISIKRTFLPTTINAVI